MITQCTLWQLCQQPIITMPFHSGDSVTGKHPRLCNLFLFQSLSTLPHNLVPEFMVGTRSLLSALHGCQFAFGISLAVNQTGKVTQILHVVHVPPHLQGCTFTLNGLQRQNILQTPGLAKCTNAIKKSVECPATQLNPCSN